MSGVEILVGMGMSASAASATVTAIQVIGTVVSAVGALSGGANAQKAANANARIGFQNANAARLSATEQAKRERRLGLKRQGSRRAFNSEALDLLEDSAIEEALLVQTILHGGEIEALGFENQSRAEIARGRAARQAGFGNAAGALLMGAANIDASSWIPSSSPATMGTVSVFNNSAESFFHPFKTSFSPIVN